MRPCGASGSLRILRGKGHDDGDTCLVIGAQQRRAAGSDNVVANLLREIGKDLRIQDQIIVVREMNRRRRRSCGARSDLTPDASKAGAVSTWARKATVGAIPNPGVAGIVAMTKPVSVSLTSCCADFVQLCFEQAKDVPLAIGTGHGSGVLVALRIDTYIAKEAVFKFLHALAAHVCLLSGLLPVGAGASDVGCSDGARFGIYPCMIQRNGGASKVQRLRTAVMRSRGRALVPAVFEILPSSRLEPKRPSRIAGVKRKWHNGRGCIRPTTPARASEQGSTHLSA